MIKEWIKSDGKSKVKQSAGDRIFIIVIYIILLLSGAITLFPFLDVVFNSLMSSKELVESANQQQEKVESTPETIGVATYPA